MNNLIALSSVLFRIKKNFHFALEVIDGWRQELTTDGFFPLKKGNKDKLALTKIHLLLPGQINILESWICAVIPSSRFNN